MSWSAARHTRWSKRQVRAAASQAVTNLNGRADRIKGKVVITPRAALKDYVKWTLAIRRALVPLANQFGFRIITSQEHGQVVCQ